MRVPVTVVAALAVWVDATLAQAPTGVPAVDSANVARAAWSSAVGAARQNDVNAAFANAERAAAAWPTQQSFVWYSALFAAQLGDSNAVRQALERYARLGLGRDLSDTTFDRYRLAPWFRDLARRHDANRAAIVNSVVRVRLSDSTTWPEGVDFDARSGSFYVTSIRHRTLVEVTRDGRERALWPRDRPGIGAVFAVRVDSRRNVIWATTSATPQMSGYTLADSGLAPSAMRT